MTRGAEAAAVDAAAVEAAVRAVPGVTAVFPARSAALPGVVGALVPGGTLVGVERPGVGPVVVTVDVGVHDGHPVRVTVRAIGAAVRTALPADADVAVQVRVSRVGA